MNKSLEDSCEIKFDDLRSKFRHYFNPLHVYCRLCELGIPKKTAINLGKIYEKYFYNGNGGSKLSKLLKTARNLF